MSAGISELQKLVTSIYPLVSSELEAFSSVWHPFEAGRKEILTVAGEPERYLYFVCEGVQRVYFVHANGKEATLVFTYKPSFGGVFDAFLMQRPSAYFYETLTPSIFLRAGYHDISRLMQNHHAIETFMRKGITAAASGVMERLTELQCLHAEERFKALLQRSPHILHLIPHKYLADYLGMDATNFSKLMNKVKI